MPTVYIQSSAFLPTPTEGAGAVEYLVWKMAEGLARRDWRVFLFALEGSQLPPNGVLVEIDRGGDAVTVERAIKHQMRDWIEREPPDVIFDHSLHMFAAMRKDIPYVAMSHGMAPLPTWARNVVFTSAHHGKLHKARDPHALLLGVDLAEIPVNDGPRDGLFWAGRILPYKRLHWACEIAKRAGLPLTVAGPIADQAYFDEVQRTWGGTMRYLGALAREDVLRHMAASRYVLFTSDETEPAGLVMLEAQACGTPVIAVNNGSAREYIAHATIANSVDQAGQWIRDDVFPDEGDALTNWRQQIRAWITERFTIDHMVTRAEEYLNAAIAGARW